MALTLAMWTIYKHPSDYPGKYVARRFDVSAGGVVGTDNLFVEKDYNKLLGMLPLGLHCLPRDENDDPNIVETWL